MSNRPSSTPPEIGSVLAGTDRSNGYDAVATEFIAHRTRARVGAVVVREWAGALPRGAEVLDLGCGHGVPLTEVFFEQGLSISGVDASPRMVAAFRARFPEAVAECAAVEDSRLLEGRFDAVVAWGLLFLLAPEVQELTIRRVSAALKPGGRFLFTAPQPACEWPDALTRRLSVSLGAERYRALLGASRLVVDGEAEDEGQNHYYFARKPARGAPGG